jgi:hypothetical protein
MTVAVQVLLADDHKLFRQGLASLIKSQTDWQIGAQTARRGGAASGFSIALPATHAKPAKSFRPTAAAHGSLSVAASTGVKFSGNFSQSFYDDKITP